MDGDEILFRPPAAVDADVDTAFMDPASIAPVRAFHQSVPQYRVTPLHPLGALADELGFEAIFVKDEASRFGLGAFKGLGGLWAMARVLAERLGDSGAPQSFPHLRQRAVDELDPRLTFVTATAGNHGRGVGWAARQFGTRAVAVVPRGTAAERIEPIRAEGAEVEVFGGDFEAAVDEARRLASEHDWILLQDTAWKGYEKIPRWVMQGYGTLVAEALEQIAAEGSDPPTHVLLQVGVGSFAAATTAALAEALEHRRPRVFSVEPAGYGPLFAAAETGRPEPVRAGRATTMTCLACTEVSTLAWPILRRHSSGHFLCGDDVTASGERLLAEPLGDDPPIASGPSGAVGAGLVAALGQRPDLAELRTRVGLSAGARVLLVSTEGRPSRGR